MAIILIVGTGACPCGCMCYFLMEHCKMTKNITWQWLKFSQLTVDQLYEILRLREMVFTFEQHCTEIDIDGLDKSAIHLLGTLNGNLVAYARFFLPGAYRPNILSIGRLVADPKMRSQGLGKKMMKMILEYFALNYKNIPIECSVQVYLREFYESFGFYVVGEPYDEGGISHIKIRHEGAG